jgi:hypothetical protein
MFTCLEVCFVVEFTYLEALLHMWQLFTIWGTCLHILMHVFHWRIVQEDENPPKAKDFVIAV